MSSMAPKDDIPFPDEKDGIDFEAGVLTGAVRGDTE